MRHVLGLADKANGAIYASLAGQSPYPPEFIYGASCQVSQQSGRDAHLCLLLAQMATKAAVTLFTILPLDSHTIYSLPNCFAHTGNFLPQLHLLPP